MKVLRTYSLIITLSFLATFSLAFFCDQLCNAGIIFPKHGQLSHLPNHNSFSDTNKDKDHTNVADMIEHDHEHTSHEVSVREMLMAHEYNLLSSPDECCEVLTSRFYSSLFVKGVEKITFKLMHFPTFESPRNFNLQASFANELNPRSELGFDLPPPVSGHSIRISIHSFLN